MLATHNPNYRQGADIIVTRRICDNNSKVLLVNVLAKINWSSLYHMQSCEDMTNCFYDTINALFDEYLPICKFKRHSSDKPWITDRFRSLIKRRQYAFRTGNSNDYNKYRNASQRLAKKLRTEYYNRQISKLRQSSHRKWWRNVKQFVGLARSNDSDDLIGLANELYDSDSDKMASDINDFFHSVLGDIPPSLDDDILNALDINDYEDTFIIYPWQVEQKLSNICSYKAAGPDGLPNWFLKEMAPFVVEPICAVFKASITQGHVPNLWSCYSSGID